MPSEADLWLRGAQADFQAVTHKRACISDLQTMCCQIEDMVYSVALGLNELTEVLRVMKNRVDHIEAWVQAQQTHQDHPAEQEAPADFAVVG
jgi:hypothetical protein